MIDLLLFVAGLIIGIALCEHLGRERRHAADTLTAWLTTALELERQRARDLAVMLDQAVAAKLQVAPPMSATVGPTLLPLPVELQQELDQLDSDAARAEYEILIRDYLTKHPEASTADVLAAVMP